MVICGETVGIENFGYKDKSTGEQKTALRIHFQYANDRITGIGCGTVFIPNGVKCPVIGESIRVVYANKAYMFVDAG